MKPSSTVPVERRRIFSYSAPKRYVMRDHEDLDEVLDRVFGATAFVKTEYEKGLHVSGWIVTPSKAELIVYKEGET